MKLLELKLKYFRQYHTADLVFSDGLTAIIGANGAGKTTLVEAIFFALFGSKAIRGNLDNLATRNHTATKSSVTLTFQYESRILKVERTVSDAKLYLLGNETELARGTRDVNEAIESHLGMNYQEFITTYATEQKGLEFLATVKGAAERERFILRVLGYDKYEKMQEIIRNDRRDLKQRLQQVEQYKQQQQILQSRIEVETKDYAKLAKQELEAINVLTQASQAHDKATLEFNNINQLKAIFDQQSVELRRLEIENNQLELSIAGLRRTLDSIKPEDQEKLLTLDHMKEQHSILQSDLSNCNNQLNAIALKRKTDSAKLQAELDNKLKQTQQLQLDINQLHKLGKQSVCESCGQELGESVEKAVDIKQVALQQLKDEVLEIKKKFAQLAEPSSDEQTLALKIKQFEADHLGLQQNIQYLHDLKSRSESLQGAKIELQLALDKQNQLLEDIQKLNSKLSKINFNQVEYERLRLLRDNTSSLLDLARLQKVRIEGQVKTAASLLKRSQEDHEQVILQLAKFEQAAKSFNRLESLDRLLTEFRKHINSELRPNLANIASQFLSDLSDGRYHRVEIQEDFTPTVVDDGTIKEVISGGEQDILNLCVRLALSQMLADRSGHQFSLLILDEVFGALDERRRANVLELLDRLALKFEQVIIITHLDDIKDAVHNIIEVSYDAEAGNSTFNDIDQAPVQDSFQEYVANI